MTTLAQFRTAIANQVGLDNSTGGDQGAIDLWINEGYTELVLRTNAKVQKETFTLIVGTSDYTLPTTLLKIQQAYIVSTATPYNLQRVAPEQIISMRLSSSANVSPAQYYSLQGSDLFMIYPTPATADTLTVYYVARPTALSVSSDSPSDLPAEWHKGIEYYGLWQAAQYDDDASSHNGADYMQLFEALIARARREIAMKGGNRLPRVKVDPRRAPIPHDRSMYPLSSG